MPSRDIGVIRKQFVGDTPTAKEYVGIARTQIGILKNLMSFNNLSQLSRTVTLANGVVITVRSIGGIDSMAIYAPESVLEEIAASEVAGASSTSTLRKWRRTHKVNLVTGDAFSTVYVFADVLVISIYPAGGIPNQAPASKYIAIKHAKGWGSIETSSDGTPLALMTRIGPSIPNVVELVSNGVGWDGGRVSWLTLVGAAGALTELRIREVVTNSAKNAYVLNEVSYPLGPSDSVIVLEDNYVVVDFATGVQSVYSLDNDRWVNAFNWNSGATGSALDPAFSGAKSYIYMTNIGTAVPAYATLVSAAAPDKIWRVVRQFGPVVGYVYGIFDTYGISSDGKTVLLGVYVDDSITSYYEVWSCARTGSWEMVTSGSFYDYLHSVGSDAYYFTLDVADRAFVSFGSSTFWMIARDGASNAQFSLWSCVGIGAWQVVATTPSSTVADNAPLQAFSADGRTTVLSFWRASTSDRVVYIYSCARTGTWELVRTYQLTSAALGVSDPFMSADGRSVGFSTYTTGTSPIRSVAVSCLSGAWYDLFDINTPAAADTLRVSDISPSGTGIIARSVLGEKLWKFDATYGWLSTNMPKDVTFCRNRNLPDGSIVRGPSTTSPITFTEYSISVSPPANGQPAGVVASAMRTETRNNVYYGGAGHLLYAVYDNLSATANETVIFDSYEQEGVSVERTADYLVEAGLPPPAGYYSENFGYKPTLNIYGSKSADSSFISVFER
jgi:hypothetical protein